MRTDAEPLASNRTLKLSATPILSDVAAPKISIPPELECTLGKVSTPDPPRRYRLPLPMYTRLTASAAAPLNLSKRPNGYLL